MTRITGQLADHQQSAEGLGVGLDDQVVLCDAGGDGQVRAHPIQVAAGSTRAWQVPGVSPSGPG
ncbi:MAG TPA: hypothetical protein VIU11_01585 [Nakamurella sp.]